MKLRLDSWFSSQVWPEMVVDRANVKSVRFTAMDDDQIKVFLVTVCRFPSVS